MELRKEMQAGCRPPLLAPVAASAGEQFYPPPLRSWERWRLAGNLKRSLHGH
jgi:hypothetical protein